MKGTNEMKNKVVKYPVKGSLLDLRGSIKPKNIPEDLEKVREKVKAKTTKKVSLS